MSRRPMAACAAALALAAALSGVPVAAQDVTLGPPQATPIAEPPRVPAGDGTGVRLKTDKGDILIGLFTESSPVAAENFLNLVNAGFYDGTGFHRLVPGFVIQGGDPEGTGMGGPGYTIPDEPVVGRYGRGIVAMARSQAPNSQGSQFFIVVDDEAEAALASANTYAIFGRVLEGMDVVDQIVAMPTQDGDSAVDPVKIISATVEQVTMPEEPIPGDPDLEALFPADVNGQPLVAQSNNGRELREQMEAGDPEFVDRVVGALATLGGQIEDLSFGYAGAEDAEGGVNITAIKLAGGDAAALEATLLPIMLRMSDQQATTATFGDRTVTMYTDGPDSPDAARFYALPSGEVLWVIQGTEPWLSEAIAELP